MPRGARDAVATNRILRDGADGRVKVTARWTLGAVRLGTGRAWNASIDARKHWWYVLLELTTLHRIGLLTARFAAANALWVGMTRRADTIWQTFRRR